MTSEMIQRLLVRNSGSVTSWKVVGPVNIGAALMKAPSAEPALAVAEVPLFQRGVGPRTVLGGRCVCFEV